MRSTCAMPEQQSKAASSQLASIKAKHETQVPPSPAQLKDTAMVTQMKKVSMTSAWMPT